VRKSLAIGRDRFARVLDVSPKTVMRWERFHVEPRTKQKELLAKMIEGIQCNSLGAVINAATVNEAKEEEVRLVGAFLDSIRELREEAFDRCMEKYSEMRIQREKKSPHVHVPQSSDEDIQNEPYDYRTLLEYVRRQHWQVVIDFGPIVMRNRRLTEIAKDRTRNWIAIATMRLGRYSQARKLFEGLLENCGHRPTRIAVLSNLAWVYIRLNLLDLARNIAEKSIEEDESWLPGLFNRLCVASAEKRRRDCRRYFKLLKQYHGDLLANPSSELAVGLRTDPDLGFIHEKMPKLFSNVTTTDNGKKG